MGSGDTLLNSVIGAIVTVVLSFTGFSPLLGGGVAGYLQAGSRRSGAKVGGLSGLLAAIPILLLLIAFFGIVLVIPVTGGFGMPGGPELIVFLVLILPFVVAWNVGLGALGGFLGTYVREEMNSSNGESAPV